jgi:long-subunit acyl-CoA synthetase (AMP-forming)
MFNLAYSRKKALMDAGIVRNDTFWDRLVFGKIQQRLGGCVRLMITGAAPIDHSIIEFLRIAVGCQVLEGYGQSEVANLENNRVDVCHWVCYSIWRLRFQVRKSCWSTVPYMRDQADRCA